MSEVRILPQAPYLIKARKVVMKMKPRPVMAEAELMTDQKIGDLKIMIRNALEEIGLKVRKQVKVNVIKEEK